MARILVTSAGYRGDVLPFVSVSRELAARGHEIDLVVPSGFHDAFAAEPVTLHRLGVEFSPRELFGIHRGKWDRYGTQLGAMRMTRWMVRYSVLEHLDSIYDSVVCVADRRRPRADPQRARPRTLDRRAAPDSVCDAPRGADSGAERRTPSGDATDAGDPRPRRSASPSGRVGRRSARQRSSSSPPTVHSVSTVAGWDCRSSTTSSSRPPRRRTVCSFRSRGIGFPVRRTGRRPACSPGSSRGNRRRRSWPTT